MSSIADSRWRVLPIGRAATLARATRDAVLFGVIGQVVLFAVVLLGGLLAEEVLAETSAGTTIDLVGRATLVGDLVLGGLGLLAFGVVHALDGPLMARALAAAKRRGTPATWVPIPGQWESARSSSAQVYKIVAVVLLALLGLFYVIAFFVALTSGFDRGWAGVLGGGALLLALIWGGMPLTDRVFGRWQSRHFAPLPQWWTEPHRIIAAGRAMTPQEIIEARGEAGVDGQSPARASLPGSGVRALSRVLLSGVSLGGAAWVVLFHLVVAVAYPDATTDAGRQLGDRAELGPEGEQLVDLLSLGMGIAGGAALLAGAGCVVCTIIVRRIEHRVLRRALADPAAVPPPYALLGRAMTPTSLPILKVLFASAGAGATLGMALWFVDAVADLPDWDSYAAAGPELRAAGELGPVIALAALVVMALGIVVSSVLDARDRELRDELGQRWPAGPAQTPTDETTGPSAD
ncbi:hypothetical protein [Brachybacterium sp.]|uniref:hypothetical protein n=1 Tax=Brachybacterium sp. TaxID=1891286 RepID=UPI002ED0AA8F